MQQTFDRKPQKLNCRAQKMTPLRFAERMLPGIKWLRGYTPQDAVADMIAGITVGLTVLPQSLAYATLAGLNPQYGLYSAFVGGVVYAFLGSCRQVTIGPTALLALMTSQYTGFGLNSGPTYAILLCLISGIVELAMAMLRLGALVDLISLPVTVGFTSATAVIIATSQLKGLLGLRGGSGSGFLDTITSVFQNLHNIRLGDFSLGVTAIIVLLLLRKLKDVRPNPAKSHLKEKQQKSVWSTVFWVVSTGRNALVVVVASLLAFYSCDTQNDCSFILTGQVKSGLPSFEFPRLETTVLLPNGTSVHQSITDMISVLGPSMLILPIIAVLGNVAISKAFGGGGLSPSRELVALSLSNIFGAFFSSFPVTGSFSRSAVNHASGVRTPLGGLYTSALVLLALSLLAPYFQYIPKSALSAVIISAVIFMIEFEVIKPMWRCSRRELLPGAITFITSLAVGVEFGILLGVAADVVFLIYRAARPAMNVHTLQTTNGIEYILMQPQYTSLYFPAVEWVRSDISKIAIRHSNRSTPVVFDCSNLHDFDFTAARGLGLLNKELTNKNVLFFLMNLSKQMGDILKECTAVDFNTIDWPDDLESYLDPSELLLYDSSI